MKFLIDECLSINLTTVAGQLGYEAQHVADIGRAGWKDWNVLRYAADGDFILVTNNASDFRRLYKSEAVHPGLVIVIPNVRRAQQTILFQAALAELAAMGEPINHVLEVDIDRDEVVLTLYDLP